MCFHNDSQIALMALAFTLILAGCSGNPKSSNPSTPMSTIGQTNSAAPTGGSNSTTGTTGSGMPGSGQSGMGGSGSGSGSGGGASAPSPVAFAYVGGFNNTSIDAFAVESDGTLQIVPGSPFNGAATQPVVTSANLFTTDGTNLVTFALASDGSLKQTSSTDGTMHNATPAPGQISSLSLDHTGQSLYVGEVNGQGTDNNDYQLFSIGKGGTLNFQQLYGYSANYQSPLVFSPDNRFAYGLGCYFANWDVFGFIRAADGTLTTFNPNTTIPTTGPNDNNLYCPEVAAISAKNYLALAYSPANSGSPTSIVIYQIRPDGTLSLVPGSATATADNNTAQIAMSFDSTGTFLVAAGNGGIESYSLMGGKLTPLGAAQDAGVSFSDIKWDHSNHVLAIGNGQLYVLNAQNGVLTQATGSPYSTPQGSSLAVLPLQ